MSDDLDALPDVVGETRMRTDELGGSARQFASLMTRSFAQASNGGKKLDDVLKRVALSLSKLSMQNAFRPLTQDMTQGFGDSETTSAPFAAISAPASIHVQIATPDADSFRRSEAYVTGQIARAVARGQRGL